MGTGVACRSEATSVRATPGTAARNAAAAAVAAVGWMLQLQQREASASPGKGTQRRSESENAILTVLWCFSSVYTRLFR